MSGIFGIYHPGSKPINPSHLQGMADGISHRGPDGTKSLIQPHIGFGHSMLHTTPESLAEILPYIDPESRIVITADARIDNREELFNKLGIQQKSSIADSQLILEAYKKWGTDGIPKLLGDFAFSLWDPASQRLICARDYIGVKPFYYHYNSRQFLFSSELKQLAEHPELSLHINEGMIGEYLSFSLCSNTETLFNEINRLSPGHYLEITPTSKTITKYWSLKPDYTLNYKNSSEYTEHFIEIFGQAVDSRLRSTTEISAEISGGLDSTSVTAMAHSLLKKQPQNKLKAYAMIFPGLQFDEQIYLDSISKETNLPIQYIDSRNYTQPDWHAQINDTFELPDIPNLFMRDQLIQRVIESKSRILLSGIGGDEWFSGSGYPYIDYLKRGQYRALINELRLSLLTNKSFALKHFTINILWPLTPIPLRKALCSHNKQLFPEWLPEPFISKIKLRERIRTADPRPHLSNLSNLSIYNVISKGFETYFLETMDRYHAKFGIEYRSSFLDRRITEFAKAIPDYERYSNQQIKFILRNPQNSLLPELIRNRNDKADFSFFFGKAFSSNEFKNSIHNCEIEQKGWANSRILQKRAREKQLLFKKKPCHSGKMTWETWFAFAIEMWYENLSLHKKRSR